MPSTGPTRGRPSAVTVARASSDIPVSRAHTSFASKRRSGVMIPRMWVPAPAALLSRSSWIAAMSAAVSCMPRIMDAEAAPTPLVLTIVCPPGGEFSSASWLATGRRTGSAGEGGEDGGQSGSDGRAGAGEHGLAADLGGLDGQVDAVEGGGEALVPHVLLLFQVLLEVALEA